MDPRICIKFCVTYEIVKCNKVCKMLKNAYGESAMSKTRVYEWYKRFQDGREDVEDDERPGRPNTSTTDVTVEKVKEMVMNDRRITIRQVADDIGISIGSCHEICGKKIHGFCNTIMHLLTLHCLFVNFWPKTIL